jgi:hypothetical protein
VRIGQEEMEVQKLEGEGDDDDGIGIDGIWKGPPLPSPTFQFKIKPIEVI